MLKFQERRRIRHFMYSKVTLFFLILLTVVLFSRVWGVYKKQRLTENNLAKTATSMEALQTRQDKLSSEIERLKTTSGLEEEIREKYGLVKPGEEVIVIVDKKGGDSVDNNLPKPTFWQRIKEWLK